jgi:hypothetical protein
MANGSRTSTELSALSTIVERARSEYGTAAQTVAARRADLAASQHPGVSAAERARAAAALTAAKKFATAKRDLLNQAISAWNVDLTPAVEISLLKANVPLALLPVRIETRYSGSGVKRKLSIRVYPDEIHAESLEERLTADEVTALAAYRAAWTASGRVAASDRTKLREAAWSALVKSVGGAPRAAWLLSVDPAKVGERPPNTFGRAEARLLPDRWIVIGYKKDAAGVLTPLFQKTSLPIQEPLALTPDWSAIVAGETVDEDARWTMDFGKALAVGMGISVGVSDYPKGKQSDKAMDEGLDRLIVFGVKGSLSATASADALATLLKKHAFSRGLATVPQGTPTNNLRGGASGWTDEDDSRGARFLATRGLASTRASSDGGRILSALGLSTTSVPDFTLQDGVSEDKQASEMLTLLWGSTWGFVFSHMLGLEHDVHAAIYTHAREHVRARGPFSVFRVGGVPYGLLPVTSLDGWPAWPTSGGMLATHFDRALAETLRKLRTLWRLALSGSHVPTVVGATNAQDALAAVLSQEGVSQGLIAQPVWTVHNHGSSRFIDAYSTAQDEFKSAISSRGDGWLNRLRSLLLLSLVPGNVEDPTDAT